MGKWAEVHCDCPNRLPLPRSDFYEPHRNKHRLTKREKAEVEEWKETTKNMFECGHRSGLVIELSPSDIIHLGNVIGNIFRDGTFEVFTKVGDWRCYEDELLLIQPDEADLWLMEIEDIQSGLQGLGSLPRDKIQKLVLDLYRDDLGGRQNLETRLGEVMAKAPSGAVAGIRENVQQSKLPNLESTVEVICQALADAAKLCRASAQTNNPIRLLW